jgi:hypothetical protein
VLLLADELGQQPLLFGVAADRTHAQFDVGAVESRDDDARIGESQEIDDIVANFRCGGRREGRDWHAAWPPVAAQAQPGGGFQDDGNPV